MVFSRSACYVRNFLFRPQATGFVHSFSTTEDLICIARKTELKHSADSAVWNGLQENVECGDGLGGS